ncbi:MAG: ChbG/HpnK family deacetylase [Anaerolineae bacterium]|nr:ChbG/HpnK family deacetylase [Anaerolineae bacterium]
MVAYLIVNADDFGITEGTNRAIIDAFQRGIVTSTSLLANGYAFDHAVALAHENPSLGIGVHLTLTEGPPVSANNRQITRSDGKLPLSNQPFARALIAGRLPRDAIRREFAAQINKVVAAGIKPTHVDGHKYIHLLPGISAIVANLARQFSIPVMRVPHRLVDTPSRIGRVPGALILMMLGTLAYRVAQRAGLRMSDRVIGFVETGHLTHDTIRRLLAARPPRPGITEVLTHPAYRSPQLDTLLADGYQWIASYDFDGETGAISDPAMRREIEAAGWQLTNFTYLAQPRDSDAARAES